MKLVKRELNRAENGKSLFWRVYAIVFASLCALLALAIFLTGLVLKDFESARPGYVAEEVFDIYFGSEDPSALLEKSGFEISEFEKPEDFRTYWESASTQELSFLRVSADNGGETVRYNVRSGEKTLAAFELSLNGEKTRFGNELYALSSIELGVSAKEVFRISVPSEATVYLNGIPVDEKYLTQEGIETESCAHMPEGVSGITYKNYEVKGLFYAPKLEVKSADGRLYAPEFDEEKGMYTAPVLYGRIEEVGGRLDYVLEAAKTYAAAMQNDKPRGAALSYLVKDSDLYKQTAGLTLFVADHTGYRFEDVEVREYYAYDENTFSCRISFDHVLTGGSTRFNDKGENHEFVDITWYFKKVGNKFLIYDRENN